jgi:cysteine desulfurase/selenocysteine lyase
MDIKAFKMDGLGNDFVIIDNRQTITNLTKEQIIKICDRKFIGCDQLILIKKNDISYGDLPNKYEAGTMATAQVIAFDESIKFLNKIGMDKIIKHEKELIEYGQEILRKNNSVKLIGNPKTKGSVLSFTIDGIHPHDIATILDEDGVAIRAGHHCCQILHDKLDIAASARASLGVYNTKDDLDKLNSSINKCKKIFELK